VFCKSLLKYAEWTVMIQFGCRVIFAITDENIFGSDFDQFLRRIPFAAVGRKPKEGSQIMIHNSMMIEHNY
jgi:hypothetical protein